MNSLSKRFATGLLFVVFLINGAHADDIGINSARLIQLSDSSYLFEAEFSQLVVMDFEIPVFPERFHLSNLEYDENAGLITIRILVTTTSGRPLDVNDEIILPWRRNGISLTVRWLDGSIHQGLFMRSVDGIRVPVNLLMTTEKSLAEVSWESFITGLKHTLFGFIHGLFILALVIYLPKRKLLTALMIFAFGQGTSMLFFEFGIPGPDLLYMELLILILAIALLVVSIKNLKFRMLESVIFLIGLFHGLSVGRELKLLELPFELTLIAQFICNITIDLIQLGLGFALVFVFQQLKNRQEFYKLFKYSIGAFAVFITLTIFYNNVLTGQKDILVQTAPRDRVVFSKVTEQNQFQMAKRPQAAQTMTNPILSYVSIEPFEIRHEILINASTALKLLNLGDNEMVEIPIELQEKMRHQIIDYFLNSTTLEIDGKMANEIISRADFVSLGMTGVLVRSEPVIESVAEGIIGVSFIYETTSLADLLSLKWNEFPKLLDKIDATTIDPFGGANYVITQDDTDLNWESSMSGYTVPKVEAIAITSPRLSLASFIIFVLAIALLLINTKYPVKKSWGFMLLSIGFMIYPFLRTPLDVDFIKQWKPSQERITEIIDGLLTNVYRSFDYRNESDVYDRLAISVAGDQLTQIYIEQRKGLEIESRGGAKAKVNDVEVLQVFDVLAGKNNEYGIDVGWRISGSVSHFGHMHYRQNRYRAIIWLIPDQGNWKIQKIEMMDEERLL